MYSGGGGSSFFTKGVGEAESLIDRTCDLYWTPVPLLDPSIYHEFYSTMVTLFFSVYFRLSSCIHYKCMFYSNLKWNLVGSLLHRCVSMIRMFLCLDKGILLIPCLQT